ncbi:MAG TPA: hypothetical protein VFT74_11390, partial [Isosphaeraceae bacterium]|nr:hypothetical protein [Isosphaeraceae bacterium]
MTFLGLPRDNAGFSRISTLKGRFFPIQPQPAPLLRGTMTVQASFRQQRPDIFLKIDLIRLRQRWVRRQDHP